MTEKSEILKGNEVISVSPNDRMLMAHHTFMISEFRDSLIEYIGRGDDATRKKWCVEGVACKMLSPKQGWREGTIKISLEFIPDEPEMTEPESPLDDIRRKINQT